MIFGTPVFTRGGIVHLAWKGEAADRIELSVQMENEERIFEWSVRLIRAVYEFYVHEHVDELLPRAAPTRLLEADRGEGWWWSGSRGERVALKQAPTTCALAAAAGGCVLPRSRCGGVRWPMGVLRSESFSPSP